MTDASRGPPRSTVTGPPFLGDDSGDDDDFAPDPNAKQRHFLIYTDESGMHGSKHYAFGALWMHWERRGDFQKIIAGLRRRHAYTDEIKWQRIKSRPAFYEELVDEFFRRSWMMFHALIVKKSDVNLRCHDGDLEVAMQKHFTMFLNRKIARYATPGKRYRVRVDYRNSPFKKADEVAGIISNRVLERRLQLSPIDSVRFQDSRRSHGIQLADLLLGCVFSGWEREPVVDAKHRLRKHVAQHLGWPDLHWDTFPTFGKFNIWQFWDPQSGRPRPKVTKRPVLRELPGWRVVAK